MFYSGAIAVGWSGAAGGHYSGSVVERFPIAAVVADITVEIASKAVDST